MPQRARALDLYERALRALLLAGPLPNRVAAAYEELRFLHTDGLPPEISGEHRALLQRCVGADRLSTRAAFDVAKAIVEAYVHLRIRFQASNPQATSSGAASE